MDINLDDVVKVGLRRNGEVSSIHEAVSHQNFQVIALDAAEPPTEICILMDKKGGFPITEGNISSLRRGGYKVSSKIDQYKDTGKMGLWIYKSIIVAKTAASMANGATQRQADYEPCAACKEPIYMGAKGATCFSCRSNPMRKYY